MSTATHNIHQNSAGNKSAAQGDQTMGTARKKAGVFQKQGVDKSKDNKNNSSDTDKDNETSTTNRGYNGNGESESVE